MHDRAEQTATHQIWRRVGLVLAGLLLCLAPVEAGLAPDEKMRSEETRSEAPHNGASELEAALVFGFQGFVDESGSAVVEWQTGSAAATVGFRLVRDDGGRSRPVHPGWLAPAFGAPAGSVYQVVDPGARIGGVNRYFLAERDESGGIHLHGPFAVRFAGAGERLEPGAATAAHPRSQGPELHRPVESGGRDVVPTDPLATVAKAVIREDGLYRIDAVELAAALGQTKAKVRTFISRGLVSLSNRGDEVAWFAGDNDDELYFYAERIDHRYTLDNVYWIRLGRPGTLVASVDGSASGAQPGGHFPGHAEAEVDAMAALNSTKFEDVDYWYWDGLDAANPNNDSRTFPLSSPDLAPVSETASLTVRLAGATKDPGYKYHHAVVSVNGTPVGDIQWIGLFTVEQTLDFSSTLLLEENTIEVTGVVDPGNLGSIFFIDSFELEYPRLYQAAGDQLRVTGATNAVVTVEGVPTDDVVVLELGDVDLPRRTAGVLVEAQSGDYRVSFTPADPDLPYLVATLSGARSVHGLAADRMDSSPTQPEAGGEYLIITPGALREGAERLADYREKGGLQTYVITLEDLHDEFADGIADPWAINSFLGWAAANWSVPPHYVVLVGKGTYDPKDNLGHGDNLLTPVLAATPYGMAAADSLLADIDGDRKLDFALGRIPVVSAVELDAYIDKVIAFETGSGAWLGEALLLADDPDAAGDFTAQSDTAGTHLPEETEIFRSYLEYLPIADARAAMFDGWTAGKRVVNYVGHGGVDILASEQLLIVDEVAAELTHTGMPAIFSALSCIVGRFELSGHQALSEALLVADDGGAVTVWAPTSPSLSGAAMGLNQSYFDLMNLPGQRIGNATLGAIQAAGPTSPQFLLETFTLLGDPGLMVQ